jgi:hypothetical protein
MIPKNLKLGVVNHETDNCLNMTNLCDRKHLSCNFIDELYHDRTSFILRSFSSIEAGYSQLKQGQISSLLEFSKNFTSAILQFNKKHRRYYNAMEVYIDDSDYVVYGYIKDEIMEIFINFNEKLGKCQGKKSIVMPIRRSEIHGNFTYSIQKSGFGASFVLYVIY